MGSQRSQLLDIYDKQVRAVLELAVPIWQPALTIYESKQIERVQRSAFYIILGRDYESYDKALAFLGREALEIRRVHLCQKFATRTIKKPKICKLVLLNGQSAIITD